MNLEECLRTSAIKKYMYSQAEIDKGLAELSNFYVSEDGLFILDGVWYSSVIQYFFSTKYAYNQEFVKLIKTTHDPMKIIEMCSTKDIGHDRRRIWSKIWRPILRRGMYQKIEFNPRIFRILTECHMTLVESVHEDIFIEHKDIKSDLIKIREFYIEKGHPLQKNKSADLSPRVSSILKEYLQTGQTPS